MLPLFNVPPSEPLPEQGKPLAKVLGTIERLTFHNDENGYTVARLRPEGGLTVVTIIGTFLHPVVGETVICYGHWTHHAQFGAQMSVVRHEKVRPTTSAAIEKYLGSGTVKGVGPVTAKRIVAMFGDRALEVIEQTPDELLKVPGVAKKTLDTIKSAWQGRSDVRSVMVFLQSHGITPGYAAKIVQKYRGQTIETVEQNPYRLATDIWGIGFKSADQIAQNMGFALDDRRRLEAGVVYVLSQAVETGGNVYLTKAELSRECALILGAFPIDDALKALTGSGVLVLEAAEGEEAYYTPALFDAERSLARRLLALLSKPVDTRATLPILQSKAPVVPDVELTDEQQSAVELSLGSRVAVVTGGPGVGKTTATRAIVRAFEARGKTVLLASPTGRAAKRLSEVTGGAASTVHRLLGFDAARRAFLRNADSPLECDVLLIDESSMLDTPLTNALLCAVPDSAQVIFVGDVDQLPSVGPGNVLRDIIDCGAAPVARLTKVFRQAAKSMIVSGAHAINSGRLPYLASPREPGADFVFIEEEEADRIADKIVAIVVRSLAKRGYPLCDIQVLSPMQRGSAGSVNLNARLQEAINPQSGEKPELLRGSKLLRQGDRVIQTRNNYDKLVFNGDIGAVKRVDDKGQSLTVTYDGRDVRYELTEIDELNLAYSLSIHKSQGSEFPAVIVALHTQHYALLQRNLIYTALTRAKKIAVLVGSKKALAMAVARDRQSTRRTRLKQRLQKVL